MDLTACGVISGYQISAADTVFTVSTVTKGSKGTPFSDVYVVRLFKVHLEACRGDNTEIFR